MAGLDVRLELPLTVPNSIERPPAEPSPDFRDWISAAVSQKRFLIGFAMQSSQVPGPVSRGDRGSMGVGGLLELIRDARSAATVSSELLLFR